MAVKSSSTPIHSAKSRSTPSGSSQSRQTKASSRAVARDPRGAANVDARPDERLSKAEQVYRELRDQILSGRLEPGAAIDKLTICAKLGVSRFPVQAAINRLAFERLVTIAPQHGSFVARMSPSAIREYQMIRRALECEIAALAAPRLTAADRAVLAESLSLQKAASEKADVSGFYALDVAFHQIIARPLALAHAVDALEAARTHLERMRRLLLSPQGRTAQAYAEHRTLAEALCTGDPEVARRAMRTHLDKAEAAYELIFRERPELFSA